jgi:hypothetical protein
MSLLCWHTDRLVGSGISTLPDTIFFSQFLNGDEWNRSQWNVRVGSGDGEAITALIPWTNYNLLVLKEHSIWIVNCNPTSLPSAFTIQRIHQNIGSLAPYTACQVGTDIFFLSDSGVRSINNIITSEQQKEVGPALSFPIEDVLDRLNHAAVAASCAFHWKNRYILAIPVDGSPHPNLVVVFNTLTETWSGVWTGWNPTHFAQRTDAGVKKMWMSQFDGTISDWLEYVPDSLETDLAFRDNGQEIVSKIITRALTWNDPVSPKTGVAYEGEYSP